MTTAYTSLLGLALPVTGELSGTWGDTVNTAITSLLDTAIAGTTSITTDADITLSTTTGASNQARQAIILWNPASGTTTRNITAPAQSKMYTVINASGGTQSIVIRGAGPTTGVTVLKGESALVAWNGSDFVKVSSIGGAGTFTNLTVTGNTILGDAIGDTLTVNATTSFTAPVNLPSTGRSAAAALTPTNPAFLYGVASTYTDTASSGTLAPVATFYSLARPTLSTSNVTTYTTAATLYIANAPAAAGSATITNPYALYVAAGNSLFAGNLLFTDNTYDIGASGATRPRNFYLAGIGNIGGNLLVKTATSRANITTDANLVSENGLGILATSTTYGQSSQYIRFFNSAAGYAGSISQTASGEIGMYSGGNLTLGVNTSTNAGIFTATTLNLFSAGINTWGNNYKALDLAGSFVAANGPNTIIIGTGTYIDSSNTLYTVASTAVSSYSQSVGGHQWSSAAGGSIGAPAALTQKMYLNPNGNFYLGNISAALATANILTGGAGGGVQLIRNASGNPTSGQSLGSYAFKGVDSANSNAAAEAAIEAFAAENHTGSTAATSLVFFTKPSGTGPGSSPVQAGMFTSSGLFGVGLTPTANNYFIQSYGGVRAGTSVLAQGTLSSYTGYGFFMSWESTYGRLEAYDYGGSGYQNIGISPNGGSVGVGMVGTSTYGKLSVNGNIAQYGSVASGAELGRIAWFNTATGYDVASIRTIIGAGQVNRGELSFYTNNGASQLLAMYIDRNQFVGVGNVPAYLLDVNNNSTAGVAFAVRASGVTSSQVNIGVGVLTAGRPFIGTNTSSNPLEVGTRDVTDLVFVTNSSERFRIDTSGNQTQTGTVRSQAGVVTTSQLFDINASTNRRVQVVLNNYTWTKFRIYGLRTNSGNSVCYWEGVLNNNFNTSYTNTIVAVNGSGGTITLTVSSSSSGVWDFDFNNTGSGASGYFVKEDPGYGTVTVTTY